MTCNQDNGSLSGWKANFEVGILGGLRYIIKRIFVQNGSKGTIQAAVNRNATHVSSMCCGENSSQRNRLPDSSEVDPRSSDVRTPDVPVPLSRTVYEQRHVRALFDGIAYRYDFLNHFLSSGFDFYWRKKVISLLKASRPKLILDVATGTADMAIEAARLPVEHIFGVDISGEMLKIGREKVRKKRLQNLVTLKEGAAENLPFEESGVDAVTVAFGVRNFEDLGRGLSEIFRVLRPEGVAFVLEFSQPRRAPVKQLYRIYLHRILPFLGGLISKNPEAYRYLPSTVKEFPDGQEFLSVLERAGFENCRCIPLTAGIVTIYEAHKYRK